MQGVYRNYVLLLCVALLLVLGASLSAVTFYGMRASAQRELQTQASMLALALVDQADAPREEIEFMLAQASANPALLSACVLDNKDTVRAALHGIAYEGNRAAAPRCSVPVADQFTAPLYASALITDPALPRPTGKIVLTAAPPDVEKYIGLWFIFAALLSLIFGLIAWIAGLGMERRMLKPLRKIASTAQRVSLYKDYSLRVVADSATQTPQEIEVLTESFNAMLHEIEDRNGRLIRKSEELDKSRAAAIAANNAKSQFLANVSHELRTPLNAIIGFSTMLAREQFGPMSDPKYVEYANDIHESGRHLLDVINDILDLSRAETGTLSVTFEALNLGKIIEKALNIVAGQAHERKIDVYTDLPEKMPKIYADRVRLMQILLNLVSNAIKFTNEGGQVTIRARAEAAKNNIHYFTFEVQDTGIGMSEADVRKAFTLFNQLDSGLNRKYDGAGLGLPLTKRLVELHHGKIKIDSIEGVGTTVTVRLTSDPALLD